jgi:hypothetical protein
LAPTKEDAAPNQELHLNRCVCVSSSPETAPAPTPGEHMLLKATEQKILNLPSRIARGLRDVSLAGHFRLEISDCRLKNQQTHRAPGPPRN